MDTDYWKHSPFGEESIFIRVGRRKGNRNDKF